MHELNGLVASSPIGYFAALGLLRVLAKDRRLPVRLGWRNGKAAIDGIEVGDAVNELWENMKDRHEAPEFNWSDSPRKTLPEAYRNACNGMVKDERALAFMAGWATDAVLRDGFVAVSRMDMTSGRQKLFKDLRILAQKIKKDHFHSALWGGGIYEDQSSFGLDPIALRTHAHENQAPTKSKPPGKPGLIWLAFESIPLHPVFPVGSNRAQTAGWRNIPESTYVWPVWKDMLSFEEVFWLRTLPLEKLSKRPGIIEIWASRRGQNGKFPWLLPALRER